MALGNRGMMVEAARQCVKDRKEWRAPVHMKLNEFRSAIFAWPSVLPPSRALLVITWRGVGCRYMTRLGVNCEKDLITENSGAGVKYMGKGVYIG